MYEVERCLPLYSLVECSLSCHVGSSAVRKRVLLVPCTLRKLAFSWYSPVGGRALVFTAFYWKEWSVTACVGGSFPLHSPVVISYGTQEVPRSVVIQSEERISQMQPVSTCLHRRVRRFVLGNWLKAVHLCRPSSSDSRHRMLDRVLRVCIPLSFVLANTRGFVPGNWLKARTSAVLLLGHW